jgi:ribosome-associated toxin RatA of RatAB toxin-antitoxin module
MKVNVKFPIVVDVLPARLNTPRKIVLTTWREYDLSEPAKSDGFYEAARCEIPMSRGVVNKRVFKADSTFFTQVPDENGHYPNGLNVTVPGRLNGELSNEIAAHTHATVKKLLKDKSVKFTPPAHGHGIYDLLTLPDIERYEGVLVDPQAYEDQLLAIDKIISEYAIIDNTLYKKTQEPFYAISLTEPARDREGSPYVGMTLVTDGMTVNNAVACFRLGRLVDALDFVRNAELSGARQMLAINGHRKFTEASDTVSNFPDMEATIFMTAKRVSEAFESSFNISHRPEDGLAEVLYNIPFDQLTTARKLQAATAGKSVDDVTVNADHLFELIEEVATYGETSRFNKKTIPLNLIISLWENRAIEIDLPATPKGPSI